MATSSTDTYDNKNAKLNEDLLLSSNFPVCSVTTDQNEFWTPEVSSNSASPSSEHDQEEEESFKRRIYEMKRHFHNGRYLILRNLPKDITEQDIRDILKEHYVHSVQIQSSGSTAKVLLAEPEVLENWTLNTHTMSGKDISIQPGQTEDILCIARLPRNFSEEEFAQLAGQFGRVSFSFLMRSQKTGESKGYGFVSYAAKEFALQAKPSIHGKEVQQKHLVCDWVGSNLTTVASLHSTCLYVDNLPKDYRDMGEFRSIFSKYGTPIYCQIAMRQGVLQDWGLVEFSSPEEVEMTRNHLDNHTIKGSAIRVDYWVPGVRAVNIYLNQLDEKNTLRKQALLPEPTTDKVFVQLNNLAKHNPAFAKSLQNIIQTQIQTLQENATNPAAGVRPELSGSGLTHAMGIPNGLLTNPNQVGSALAHLVSQESGSDQTLNGNTQAALMLILAAQQIQQKKDCGNFLSKPEVMAILKNLLSKGDSHSNTHQTSASTSNGSLSSSLKANFRSGYFKNSTQGRPKTPLLPTPDNAPSSARSSPEDFGANLSEIDSNFLSHIDSVMKGQNDPTPDSALTGLLSNSNWLHRILHSLQGPTPTLPSSIPPVSSMSSQTPLLHNPPTLYEQREPIMLVRPEEAPRPDLFANLGQMPAHPQAPFLFQTPVHPRAPSPMSPWHSPSFFSNPVFTPAPQMATRVYNPMYLPTMPPSHTVVSTHATSMAPPMPCFSTPSRKKRKSCHILPPPESSPENGYVGQHSQGLGGHYADSYKQKKKTKLSS